MASPTLFVKPGAELVIASAGVPISEGTITTDEGWSPYCQAKVTVDYADPADALAIDPRSNIRGTINARADSIPPALPSAPRAFDLGIRSRVVDYGGKSATLTLASDEALLQDYATLATTRYISQPDLAALVNVVLGTVIPGAAIGTPAPPATPIVVAFPLTNLLLNPSARVNVLNWTTGGGNTLSWGAGAGFDGNGYCLALASAASGAVFAVDSTNPPAIQAGETYDFSVYVRTSSGTANINCTMRFMDASGAIVSAPMSGTSVAVATGFTRIHITGTAPANAVKVTPYISYNGTVSGRGIHCDGAMLVVTNPYVDAPYEYFDGASADTAVYDFAWQDAANASPSTRTVLSGTAPEALIWRAGVSAWDFLAPLITAAALRLFCDEARHWRLVPPTYTDAGSVSITEKNAITATDTIDREDPQLWATGVVVRFTWTDLATGLVRVRIDVAGTSEKVLVVDYERPYPGAGAAAAILKSMQGRGRTQDARAVVRYSPKPGMELSIQMPGAPLVIGRVRAVEFDLALGLAIVRGKLQGDIPADSWAAVPATEKWTDSPDVSWDNW